MAWHDATQSVLSAGAPSRALALAEREHAWAVQELTALAEYNIVAPAHRAGFPIEPVGVAPLWTGALPIKGEPNCWVGIPAEEDPLWQQGRFPIPVEHYEYLAQLDQAGFNFPHVFIFHELLPQDAARIQRGGPIPIELIEPLPVEDTLPLSRRLANLGEASLPVARVAGRGALRAGGIALQVGVAVLPIILIGAGVIAMAALAGMASAASLDPAIFGAVTLSPQPRPGELAYFFLLTQYDLPMPRR